MIEMTTVVQELEEAIGREYVITDFSSCVQACENTLAVPRHIAGILRPKGLIQIVQVVRVAWQSGQKLFPVSCGKNMGYGDRAPVRDDGWLLDLSRNNSILDVDLIRGQVTVEPGVTQKQLSDRLMNTPLIMSATGASTDASVLGNAIAGGFSHGPRGNHRQSLVRLKVVLGDGRVMTTGLPFGPSLTGLFIQFNGGIIVEATIQLEAKPERFESFLVQANNLQLPQLITCLRELRRQRTANSVIHVANMPRLAQSVAQLPPDFDRSRPLHEEDAQRFLQAGFLKPVAWTAIGGLYGSAEEVAAKKKVIGRKIKEAHAGSTAFFTDRKLLWLEWALGHRLLKRWQTPRLLQRKLMSYHELHNLLQGIPSDVFVRSICWKVDDPKDLGLMWLCPIVPADPGTVISVMALVRRIFEKHGLGAPPWTWSYIDEAELVGISNITFNKNDLGETLYAHGAYRECLKAFAAHGIPSYRASIYGMAEGLVAYDSVTADVLHRIKKVLDPRGLFAPGLYGIG